jgi:L-aminopeptidase/D-esterase-like protein
MPQREARSRKVPPPVRFGHARHPREATGVTVVLFPRGAMGAVEVRGGAAGTYHTDSLGPLSTFGRLDALFFAGGSLLGLDAARGVREALERSGGGRPFFPDGPPLVSVSGAVLFDLRSRASLQVDYASLGREAALHAAPGPPEEGSVGAGTGATVGKFGGRLRACAGGVGTVMGPVGARSHLVALSVVNALGNVHDEDDGTILAGARGDGGRFLPAPEALRLAERATPPRGTTLGLVLTDLPVARRELFRLAVAGHDGIARAVRPAHTATDGDVVFAVSTGRPGLETPWPGPGRAPYPGAAGDLLVALASQRMAQSIGRAVRSARSRPGLPSGPEWSSGR